MTDAAVMLWGRRIGAVTLDTQRDYAVFEYDPEFAQSGIEISPITMPLREGVYAFPALARQTFHGLPGLLADSLPDRFGNALIDAWLSARGRAPDSFDVVERLCYVGARGMGALEFEPALLPGSRSSQPVAIDALVELASEVLAQRSELRASFADPERSAALDDIVRVGTSAGGARAKAIIAWNPATNEVRSGQVSAGTGFSYWLLKLDGVRGNQDKESEDPQGFGAIEYAYHRMALAAGIEMSECRLLEEGGRRHFMTKRFDREEDGRKLHMQSLGALAHFDFNQAGAYSYEQAMQVVRVLGLGIEAIEAMYRRMAFNIVARNQDDHVKNIAFLMDKAGRWRLAPAYDLSYSYNPQGAWTSRHQMTMNGKRDAFTREDFVACAKTGGLARGRGLTILDEVRAAVAHWSRYARDAGVPSATNHGIERALRLAID